MSECLPDMPRFIRQADAGGWEGADHKDGPWRPITAPQSGLPWPVPSVAKESSVVQRTDADRLPDHAEAVKAAYQKASDGNYINGEWVQNHAAQIAAVLRTIADKVAPSDAMEPRNYLPMALECQRIRSEILAIASELEDPHG